MFIKQPSTVYETESNLPMHAQIKNLLNPYIYHRLSSLDEGQLIDKNWLEVTVNGCEILLNTNNVKVRNTLAREHVVNYIIEERGSEIFV